MQVCSCATRRAAVKTQRTKSPCVCAAAARLNYLHVSSLISTDESRCWQQGSRRSHSAWADRTHEGPNVKGPRCLRNGDRRKKVMMLFVCESEEERCCESRRIVFTFQTLQMQPCCFCVFLVTCCAAQARWSQKL